MSKIYVNPNAYLERSETFFCRGFCRGFQTAICRREVRHERKLTWGRRVPEAAEKSPDVGRRYRCKYLRISLKFSNFTSNSNTL